MTSPSANAPKIRIDPELYDDLRLLAERDGRSVTVYVNRALADHVNAAKIPYKKGKTK